MGAGAARSRRLGMVHACEIKFKKIRQYTTFLVVPHYPQVDLLLMWLADMFFAKFSILSFKVETDHQNLRLG